MACPSVSNHTLLLYMCYCTSFAQNHNMHNLYTQEHTHMCVCHLLLVRAVSSLLCQKRSTSCSTSLALSTACCCKQHQRCMRKGTISKTSGKTDTLNSLKCKQKEYLVHPHQLSTTCSGNLVEAHCYGIGRTGQIFVLTKTFAVETCTFLSASSLLRDCSKICPVLCSGKSYTQPS